MQTIISWFGRSGIGFTLLGVLTYFGGVGDPSTGSRRTRGFKMMFAALGERFGSESTAAIFIGLVGILCLIFAVGLHLLSEPNR